VAHSLSAKKRIRQNSKQRARNRAHRGSVRTQIKKFHKLVRNPSEPDALEKELQLTQKKIDQLAQMKSWASPRNQAAHVSKRLRNHVG